VPDVRPRRKATADDKPSPPPPTVKGWGACADQVVPTQLSNGLPNRDRAPERPESE
jgi:hypothetical protein